MPTKRTTAESSFFECFFSIGNMKDPLDPFWRVFYVIMNIQKSITTYLKWKLRHTKHTYAPYKRQLDLLANYLESKKGITELKSITNDDIIDYHEFMEEQQYSDATIAYSARIIRNYFWFWKGRKQTSVNPKEIKAIKFVNAEKDIVDEDDFEQLTMVLDERFSTDLMKKLILHMLWDTGMRISELLDLKLSDISTQGKDGLRTAKVRTRKSMRYNLVVWGADTNRLLNNYLGLRLCMDTTSENNYLFINPKTQKKYTPRSVQRWMKQITGMTLVNKNITPHSFRHGKANNILEKGGNVRDVSALLRHVAPESSFHYLQLSESRYKSTASRFLKTA